MDKDRCRLFANFSNLGIVLGEDRQWGIATSVFSEMFFRERKVQTNSFCPAIGDMEKM